MATTLTDEDIQAIAESVYELILQGSANSINYGKAEDEMETPTTEEERAKYNLGVIYISGDVKQAGNMNIQALFTAFGSDAQTVLNNYVNTTLKGQLDDHTEAKETQLDQKESSLETALTEHSEDLEDAAEQNLSGYVADTLKSSLNTYVETTSKVQINEHVEDKTEAFDTHADGKIQEATDAANNAVSAKNQAEAAKDDAETAEGNVETLKAQIEALISQLENTAQTKTVFPVMIEGEQFGLSVSVDGGDVIYTISEIEPEEETA